MAKRIRFEEYVGKVIKVKNTSYKILGVTKTDSGRRKLVCECPVCSKDEELWPYGSIVTDPASLRRGRLSCGCSPQVSRTEEQYKIVVNRACSDKKLVFLGWEGPFKGGNTFLRLMNPELGYCWNTTVINYFIRTDKPCCPITKDFTNSMTIEERIKLFRSTNSFPEGSLFKKDIYKTHSDGRKCYWDYYCPICDDDEISKAGLCDGWFKSTTSRLSSGQIPCRCSEKHHYTSEQWLFRIKNRLSSIGAVFVDTFSQDNEIRNRTLVSWRCKHGHFNKDRAGVILNRPVCGTCGKISGKFGFYKHRAKDPDILYLIELSNDQGEYYVKVGRTFDLKQRFYEYNKLFDINILSLSHDIHEKVFLTEQNLKGLLAEHLATPINNFGGSSEECFTEEILSHPEIISTFNLQP